jgi:DNA polymerase
MDLITLDFETYYDTDISLRKLNTMTYVKHELFKVQGVGIKVNDGPTEWFGADETTDALHSLDWSSAAILCHNTNFDAYILTHHYNLTPKYYYDTRAMSSGLFPGQSASLKDLAIRLFPFNDKMRKGDDLIKTKGIYDLPPDIEKALGVYCIQDCDVTYACFYKMLSDYPVEELNIIDLVCRMFCEPVLKIDRPRLEKYHKKEFKLAEAVIENAGIERKILSSNKQFAEYIYSIGLVPPTKKSPTTGLDIPALGKNDAGFQQMAVMFPQFKNIWDARVMVKSRLSETRSKRLLDSANDDDTLPVPLKYYAAHTGRFGGTEKLNLQNLPRKSELRKCLIAPEGHFVYVADLSQIEARMLAWLAGEKELLQQFRDGVDVYKAFAALIYDKPVSEITEQERFVGKVAILGLGYGMGHKKFAMTLRSGAMGPAIDFTDAQAKEVVNTYRSTYPRIKLLWTKLEDLVKQTMHKDNFGYQYGPLTVEYHALRMPNGMALKYEDLRVTMEGLAYQSRGKATYTYGGRITENVIQALSRIIITDSMLRLSRRDRGRVALQVHDEIIIIATNTEPHATMETIIKDMCIAPSWCLDIPLDAEGGFDTSYSK